LAELNKRYQKLDEEMKKVMKINEISTQEKEKLK
jgi:hypothetical protein